MFKNVDKDWWLANGVFCIIAGLITFLLLGVIGKNFEYGIFSGIFNILFGLALLQKRRLIFWIYLVFVSYNFYKQILRIAVLATPGGSFSVDLQFALALVIFVMALMLWQQISKEKKVKKTVK